MAAIKRNNGLKAQSKKDMQFFWALGAIPIAWYVVLYICINFNSILYAFQSYDETGKLIFSGFTNIQAVIDDLIHEEWLGETFRRSLGLYFLMLLFTTPIPVFISFFFLR